jgi:5-methyltetrahydrofolate--homocysteine methyltransferase
LAGLRGPQSAFHRHPTATRKNVPGKQTHNSFAPNKSAHSFTLLAGLRGPQSAFHRNPTATRKNVPGKQTHNSFALNKSARNFTLLAGLRGPQSAFHRHPTATRKNVPGKQTHNSFALNKSAHGFTLLAGLRGPQSAFHRRPTATRKNVPGKQTHNSFALNKSAHNFTLLAGLRGPQSAFRRHLQATRKNVPGNRQTCPRRSNVNEDGISHRSPVPPATAESRDAFASLYPKTHFERTNPIPVASPAPLAKDPKPRHQTGRFNTRRYTERKAFNSTMTSREERKQALLEALDTRILVLDGAMGTMIQQLNPTIDDWGGPKFENCPENLLFTRPEWITGIHRAYLEAGADIVETNSFGGHPVTLAEFGLAGRCLEVNRIAAQLARRACDDFDGGRPRFVAGSLGPTTKAITVTGGITFNDLRDGYYQQAKGLWEGGADILLVETCQDTRNVKAALLAIQRLCGENGFEIPVMVSGTIEPMGTMLAGQTADALWVSIAHRPLLSVGLNCATGPEFMTDHIRTLHEMASTRISCYPNAGLPNEELKYTETPDSLARQLEKFVAHGWLNMVGGCCGTTPAHIRAIAQMADGRAPRPRQDRPHRTWFSGIEALEAEESNRPLLVGERTNVIGSRAFKQLVAEEKWEEASEIARRQVRNGAHIVDVCLQSSDRDEISDIPPFYEKLIRKIKAPLMIDTTDARGLELALTYCQGKSIINSINLEDGEEKFERICPIARAYGAALVVGTIDEDPVQAQAFTRERKLEVARRSVDLLVNKYRIPPEDIIIDPLVFPCATGDENYIGGAVETIEAIRLVKQNIPHVKTILGVSNISFGLPPAAREVVNSVFLYYATKAGLDLAIVNTEKLERFASIPVEERRLAEYLLFNTPPADVPAGHPQADLLKTAPQDWSEQSREEKIAVNQFHIAAITERFRGAAVRQKVRPEELPLDKRLANYIVEGSKDGLIADLDRKLAEGAAPLDVVNGPLMEGMGEVGRLFNNNELIVAEVLQSAEAMKAAVSYLERFMEKAESSNRARLILATVKGDVHDIGKNLVEIILANNGYQVINLGIKVTPEELIHACREHSPDAIGLSGLLVKSAQQMVITGEDLRDAGIGVPLLVGGAALSEKFTMTRIAPAYGAPTFYCRDAMTGLATMNSIMDPAARAALLDSHTVRDAAATAAAQAPPPAPAGGRRSPKVRVGIPIPAAPYLDRRVRDVPHLAEVWSYINPHMLYGRHLGYKGNFEKNLHEREPKALALFHDVENVKNRAASFMRVRAVWRFFEAGRGGNAIHLFEPGASEPAHTFRFGRQAKSGGLCLSDYILDPGPNGERDHLCLFVVTAGEGIREHSEAAKQRGEFFLAHALQALAIETAEACAEWLHRRIREDWGFPDPPTMTMQERFTSRYRGKRYSFGYPACPNLDDQQGLWKLLRPEEIGVRLTEGMMMDPEASVSALVFHHPDCAYFSIDATD